MKKRNAMVLLTLWGILVLGAWLLPAKEMSDAERRPLARFPAVSAETVFGGTFMEKFEDYSLDQFPLRSAFRTIKSLFHYGVLGQKDNNGIYIENGFAVKQEYPLDEASVDHAVDRFTQLHEKYLTDSPCYMVIVPDKNFYFAEDAGQLKMDYDRLWDRFREELPWARQIELRDVMKRGVYYRTDTHWKQESLSMAAHTICEAMNVGAQKDMKAVLTRRDFYGVYYGQAALPLLPDSILLMENELLKNCSVYDHETGKTTGIYDLEKLNGKDPYEVYLSGPKSLLTITNPAGQPGKELIVFQDSFGSAMIPLLLADYETVTVVDIRYMHMDLLEQFVDFHGQDVLLLYSTLVLNNSETIK